MRAGESVHYLFSFELLAISEPLEQLLLTALERGLGREFARQRCLLTATHTHSAPPASPLEGESQPDPAYWRLLGERAVQAALAAREQLTPAHLYCATLHVPGLTYNRRALLSDGRVSMALEPDGVVLARGPVDDILTLLAWRAGDGRSLAAIVHFACHGVAMCTSAIGADIPGQASRHVEAKLQGAHCLFLQGAAGDTNPVTVSAGRPQLDAWWERFGPYLDRALADLRPIPCTPFRTAGADLPLEYQPLPTYAVVEARVAGLERIAQGDVDSPEVQAAVGLLANLLNVRRGERLDPAKAAFAAAALVRTERRTLAAVESGHEPGPCPLRMSVWRMGRVTLVAMAGEIFAATGQRIRGLHPGRVLLPVTCGAPIVGYVPDREAMARGGYEVDDAWRFYRRPAPFAHDAEERIVEMAQGLIGRVLRSAQDGGGT